MATSNSKHTWTAPEPGEWLLSGRFEILRRIGDGGMGIVYEAFDAERRENIALKTLHRPEPAGIYQLRSEFRVLADVSHPNLVLPFLAGVPGAVARVAFEDLLGPRRDLVRSREAWQKPTFTWQDIMQAQGEVLLSAYDGDMGPALSVTELLERKLDKSLARHAASVRGYVAYVSSWTSLGRARQLKPGPELTRLLDHAAASLRFCHSKRLAAAWSSPLEPAVEALRGNTEAAVRTLGALLADDQATERLPVYAVCARRGLGTLLGGEEGAALVAEADGYLRDRGVVDPGRFVAAIAPGLAAS